MSNVVGVNGRGAPARGCRTGINCRKSCLLLCVSEWATGLLIAGVAFVPAWGSAVRTSQPITAPRENPNQQLISTLQAQDTQLDVKMSSLSSESPYAQPRQFGVSQEATNTTAGALRNPAPIAQARMNGPPAMFIQTQSASGRSCISAEGFVIPSGRTVLPADQGLTGHHMSFSFTCQDGQWYVNGTHVIASPRMGQGYTDITK